MLDSLLEIYESISNFDLIYLIFTITLEGFLDQNQSKQFAAMNDNDIEELSKITHVSETVIRNAQKKYNALSQSQKTKYISKLMPQIKRSFVLSI